MGRSGGGRGVGEGVGGPRDSSNRGRVGGVVRVAHVLHLDEMKNSASFQDGQTRQDSWEANCSAGIQRYIPRGTGKGQRYIL